MEGPDHYEFASYGPANESESLISNDVTGMVFLQVSVATLGVQAGQPVIARVLIAAFHGDNSN